MRSKCCLDLEVGDSVTKLKVANKSPFGNGDKKSSSVKVSVAVDLKTNRQIDKHRFKKLENDSIINRIHELPLEKWFLIVDLIRFEF